MLCLLIFVVFQALFKLRHETKVEHIFVVGNTGKKFEIILVKYLLLQIISLTGFWGLSFEYLLILLLLEILHFLQIYLK